MTARLLAGVLLLATIATLSSRPVAFAQDAEPLTTFDAAWTIVRDTHFDRTLNGVDWNAVRTELRPKAAAAKTVGELRAVLRDMLGRLGQSHFAVIPASGDSAAKAAHDMSGDTGIRRASGRRRCPRDRRRIRGQRCADRGRSRDGMSSAIGGTRLDPLVAELPADSRLRSVEAWRIAQERLRGTSGTECGSPSKT